MTRGPVEPTRTTHARDTRGRPTSLTTTGPTQVTYDLGGHGRVTQSPTSDPSTVLSSEPPTLYPTGTERVQWKKTLDDDDIHLSLRVKMTSCFILLHSTPARRTWDPRRCESFYNRPRDWTTGVDVRFRGFRWRLRHTSLDRERRVRADRLTESASSRGRGCR